MSVKWGAAAAGTFLVLFYGGGRLFVGAWPTPDEWLFVAPTSVVLTAIVGLSVGVVAGD